MGLYVYEMFVNFGLLCIAIQRIGRYDQHSADQLNVDVPAVEYMVVSEYIFLCYYISI